MGGYTTKAEVVSSMYPFAMSATVPEAVQNISGDFTKPMCKTNSMHRRVVASCRRKTSPDPLAASRESLLIPLAFQETRFRNA